ncbi:MAG TPA: POTRA domain-containing protein, partial [Thermodesulfovibrionales bacterium]|nr:POTRA domain-containing protein [Thermodesulfovibrionales bacterium]
MVIKEISVEGLSSLSREELLDLLDMKIGEVLDPLKIRTGIKRAFLKGIFEDIEVYSEEEKGGIRIVVKERDRIRDVNIVGNEYFSSRRIRAMFPLKEGQLLRDDRLDDAVNQLREALVERGFPGAGASVEISPASGMYAKDLTITVNEGPPLLIERIVIHGAPDEEIRDLIPMKEGDIYDASGFPKVVERIRNHYKGLGYLNPTVSHLFSDGTMDITVTLGRKLTVHFEGNTVFGSGRLAKEMPFSDAGEVRDDVIEEAERKITSLYYGKGYASCQVAPVISEAPGNATEITFFIFEGERVTVGALMFPGMTLPEKNLKEVLPLKEGADYNPNLISSNADVVREFYVAVGYLGVEVESPGVRIEQNKALITMSIKEGQKTVISEVEVTGYRSVAPEEIRRAIGLKVGDSYNEVDMADARLRVIELFQDKGFLDTLVSPKVDISGEKARITFEIEEGERTFFGKTIITGNTGTKREVIERELLHRESAPFNYGVLAKERQRLYKLGLFADVRVEALDPYDHRRDIHIEVVEGNAGTVGFGGGYNSFDKLTGFVDIGYTNLFGMNRQLSLRVGYNSLEKLYAINYVDSWFLEQPLQLKGTVFLDERDEKNIDTKVVMYRYRKEGISLGVEKRYSSTTKGEIYYEYVHADTSDVQPDIVLTAKDVGRLGISSIRPGITYDTRDNPFDPRNGVLAGVTLKVASSVLLSETSFAKAVVNGSLYHEIARPFVLAVAFRFGVAHAWGSSE